MTRSLVAVLLGMTLLPNGAHAAAGQVLFALGRVEIQRGAQVVVAQRGTPLEVGDVVSTGPTGMTQLRLRDGALLSLRYGSTLAVDEFHLPASREAEASAARPAAAPAAAQVDAARSVLRLLRGAFRTVTGVIGKSASDSYRVVTPAATIGIRGTDYSAALCAGDCGGTPDGLYVGVSNGEVFVSNDVGQLVLGDNQYAYVKDTTSPPDQQIAPPDVLETPIQAEEDGEGAGDEGDEPAPAEAAQDTGAAGDSGQADASTSDTAAVDDSGPPAEPKSAETGPVATQVGVSQPEGTYELLPGEPGSFAFALGGLRGARDNGVYTDDGGALVGFLTNVFTSIGSSQNVNQGFDEDSGLRWGRWSGGAANVGGASVDLSKRSLHWVYAHTSAAPVLPVSGTATYTLVGNTNPTDNAGHVGVLGTAHLTANFTNQTVASDLSLGIDGKVWLASGSGSIAGGTPLFSGSYGVTVNDGQGAKVGTGAGGFSGFFTHGASAAGMTYHLTSGVTTVSGAAAFGQSTAAQ